jgi:hypothetical protein
MLFLLFLFSSSSNFFYVQEEKNICLYTPYDYLSCLVCE